MSYLTGQKQYVNIDIAASGMLQTACGVPQESVRVKTDQKYFICRLYKFIF